MYYNISNIIIPYVRSAPFDPAPNNFRIDKLDSEYKLINKFPLKDNRLTTYTYI